MSDYRFQIVKHNDITCLHVMVEIDPVNDGIAHAYIPLDDVQEVIHHAAEEALVELSNYFRQLPNTINLSQVISIWNDVVEGKP